jgi:alpha-L-rhamnosidase
MEGSSGAMLFNSIRQGEWYNAGKETPGWDNTGFDDKRWFLPLQVSGPAGRLKAQMIQPIKATENLVPKTITQPQPGVYVFDIGKTIAGYAE